MNVTEIPKTNYIHRRATFHEGDRSLLQPKTNFRRSADVSLRPIDLIHPHDASNLPNTCGYVPRLMFKDGHTYGMHTDTLTRRHTRNEKLLHTRPDNSATKETYVPQAGGDRKYTDNMVPGYTGFVPQHVINTYGETYKEGTEDAICQTKRSYSDHAAKMDRLQQNVNTNPILEISANCPPTDPGHPMKSTRFMFSYYRPPNSNTREFTEAAIPGTMNFIPQKENNILGQRYSVWNKKAYEASKALRDRQETVATQSIYPPTANSWDSTGVNTQYGQIYNKHLGMVPKYTGYIPQRRYDFEKPYGDSTRSLPICKDTPGYAAGAYMDTGPPIIRTVIPVRDKHLHKIAQAQKCGQE